MRISTIPLRMEEGSWGAGDKATDLGLSLVEKKLSAPEPAVQHKGKVGRVKSWFCYAAIAVVVLM